MQIKFLCLQKIHQQLRDELLSAFTGVLDSGQFILGNKVAELESQFANYCGTKFAVGVGNGLDALELSLLAMGIGEGDEVIVPSHTFIATWLAVSRVGAKIVQAPICKNTYNIQGTALRDLITPRTKAIIPVHLYGQPADMEVVTQLADEFNIFVLEDAAQAHGASIKKKRVGAFGHAAAFSFYPGKNLGALGDGGIVTTDSLELNNKLTTLRNYGSTRKYLHSDIGANSRLDELQAAFLQAKLRKLDEWNIIRKAQARLYLKLLDSSRVILPSVPSRFDPVWHLFVVRVPQRDRVRVELAEVGVETLIHYPIPPAMQTVYNAFDFGKETVEAKLLCDDILSLPIGPHLSNQDIEYAANSLNNILQNFD